MECAPEESLVEKLEVLQEEFDWGVAALGCCMEGQGSNNVGLL